VATDYYKFTYIRQFILWRGTISIMLIEYDDFNDFCMRFLIFRGVNIVSVILLENVDGNSFTIFPMNLDLYG